jgi:uncharacterized protein (TIGR03435 family)
MHKVLRRSVLGRSGCAATVGLNLTAILLAQSIGDNSRQAPTVDKPAFEVTSIKPAAFPAKANFSFNGLDRALPGGRFSGAFSLQYLITFAFKFRLAGQASEIAFAQCPAWVKKDFYTIDAQAGRNTTKDQIRLMVQTLLEERFKLTAHFEDRDIAVLAMALDKPDKPGPQLRRHSSGMPCPDDTPAQSLPPAPMARPPTSYGLFPSYCGDPAARGSGGHLTMGARDNSMDDLAAAIQQYGAWGDDIRKAVVNRTGLKGTFDYTVEWSGRGPAPPPPGGTPKYPESEGPGFVRAIREQLGIRLLPSRATVHIPVITHVERPSAN